MKQRESNDDNKYYNLKGSFYFSCNTDTIMKAIQVLGRTSDSQSGLYLPPGVYENLQGVHEMKMGGAMIGDLI